MIDKKLILSLFLILLLSSCNLFNMQAQKMYDETTGQVRDAVEMHKEKLADDLETLKTKTKEIEDSIQYLQQQGEKVSDTLDEFSGFLDKVEKLEQEADKHLD